MAHLTKKCKDCGYSSSPMVVMDGSIRLQIVLWFMLLIPGLFYSMWRYSTRHQICPQCHSTDLEPLLTEHVLHGQH